jgi:methyl-galactoside transport system substrate-binding protein
MDNPPKLHGIKEEIMNKKLIPLLAVGMLLASCGGTTTSSAAKSSTAASSTATTSKNAAKPLTFFNRQPSNPTTGEIDMTTMNFNDKTLYVGFDAAGGGAIQGKLITDYLATKNKADIDRNNDGYIGYVLCIGDSAHNDSIARTTGIRKALGTWKTSAAVGDVQEGSVTVKDGTLKVKELASKQMVSTAGATWDAATAADAFGGWVSQYGTAIDVCVSNNDGMAMGCLGVATYPAGVPAFGYDANADAVQSVINGKKATTAGAYLTGTVSQNVDAQAAGTLQVVRNIYDGLTGEAIYTKGFTEADQYGNKITPAMSYISTSKAILAANAAVTAANAASYVSGTRDSGIKDITSKAKNIKLWINLYNGSDNFLSSSYKPALQAYAALMNITMNLVNGDGQSENSVTDNFVNLGNYDAYAINMVKTNSGSLYTGKLS